MNINGRKKENKKEKRKKLRKSSPRDHQIVHITFPFSEGNISGANQHIRANYENFNFSHQINIQGEGRRGWKGKFIKV